MRKVISKIFGFFILFVLFTSFSGGVLADETTPNAGGADPGTPTEATYKGRCELIEGGGASSDPKGFGEAAKNVQTSSVYAKYPPCANSPNECSSNEEGLYPLNCFFLMEPIGGKTGYDLYKKVKIESALPSTPKSPETPNGFGEAAKSAQQLEEENAKKANGVAAQQVLDEEIVLDGEKGDGLSQVIDSAEAQKNLDEVLNAPGGETGVESGQGPDALAKGKVTYNYVLWGGEYLIPGEEGPYQAILVYEPGKDYQGPLGLLYAYLGLAYNYISGFILGVVILIAIIGGIEMIASAGNTEQFGKGQSHIVKALIGMVIWFLASVILYTINPTFFRF